jgi:hypothetical protein
MGDRQEHRRLAPAPSDRQQHHRSALEQTTRMRPGPQRAIFAIAARLEDEPAIATESGVPMTPDGESASNTAIATTPPAEDAVAELAPARPAAVAFR